MSLGELEATYFQRLSDDGFVRHLRSSVPIPGSGWMGAMAVSARDFAGGFAADQALLQG